MLYDQLEHVTHAHRQHVDNQHPPPPNTPPPLRTPPSINPQTSPPILHIPPQMPATQKRVLQLKTTLRPVQHSDSMATHTHRSRHSLPRRLPILPYPNPGQKSRRRVGRTGQREESRRRSRQTEEEEEDQAEWTMDCADYVHSSAQSAE